MNKIITTAFLILFLSGTLVAQTEQGVWLIGGQISFNSDNSLRIGTGNIPDTRFSTNAYSLLPTVGYFFKQNWVIGGNLGYHHLNYNITNDQTGENLNSQNQWSGRGGVFMRRYLPINEQVFFHLQGGLAYTFGESETIQLQNNAILRKNRGLIMHTQAGISYFPRRWIAIEGNINPFSYSFQRTKTPQTTGDQNEQEHSFWTGLNGNFLSLGFNFFISRPR